MNNIENKILRQESGRKENICEAAKRIAAVVLSVGIMLGVSGCSTNGNASVSNADVSSSTSLDSQNLEEEWKEAVSAEKQLIYNWFTSEIATLETLSRLCEPQHENYTPKSWCIGGNDRLPEYNINRFVEFLQLINDYYNTLKTVDVSNVSSENFEKEFEEIIEGLRAEFGIVVDIKNDIVFENIPTFENEFSELKNNTSVIINEGYGITVIKNCNVLEDGVVRYRYNLIYKGEIFKRGCCTDAAYCELKMKCADSTFDVLFAGSGDGITMSDLTKDGEPVDTIDYTAEEIFQLLAPIFEGDLEFEELCKKYGFDFDTTD